MALIGGYVFDDSLVAAADLSAKQFFGVKLDTTEGQCALGAAVTDICYGILLNKPKSGETAAVRVMGRCKAVVDGSGTAIAIGDRLGLNGSGQLVKAHTADRPNCAIALQAATTAGAVIEVLMLPGSTAFRTPA